MTLESLYDILSATGIPTSYSSVPLSNENPRPYICYSQDNAVNFAADGIVYFSRKNILVRLYTDTRNEAAESLVETALSDIFWSKEIAFLEEQKIYEITYEIEV